MEPLQLLNDADGGAGIKALAQSFGLSEEETQNAVASVLPQISARIERNTLSRGGVADLVALMGAAQQHGVGRPEVIGTDVGRAQGDALLEQLFGTRDKSRAVAAKASYASGIGESVIKAMLPYIASMVINAIFKRTSGSLGDILSKIPNMGGGGSGPGSSERAPAPRGGGGGGFEDIFSRIPNIGGPTIGGDAPSTPQGAPVEMPRGGNGGFETGGRMGGGGRGQGQETTFPGGGGLPMPEDLGRGGWGAGDASGGTTTSGRNPYGDLSDIIRGGRGAPSGLPEAAAGGGVLWRLVRGIIGSVLGFQNKGVMSWLFRLIVLKFGSTILRTVLRRMFGGR